MQNGGGEEVGKGESGYYCFLPTCRERERDRQKERLCIYTVLYTRNLLVLPTSMLRSAEAKAFSFSSYEKRRLDCFIGGGGTGRAGEGRSNSLLLQLTYGYWSGEASNYERRRTHSALAHPQTVDAS